jgi:hypothetical protein
MRRYEQVVICLQDGRKLCVTIREAKLWKLVLCVVANTCGILAVLAGSWLLSHGYKDAAVYLAVAGFGLLVTAKE